MRRAHVHRLTLEDDWHFTKEYFEEIMMFTWTFQRGGED